MSWSKWQTVLFLQEPGHSLPCKEEQLWIEQPNWRLLPQTLSRNQEIFATKAQRHEGFYFVILS
jgi:hypothetical protein